MIKEITLKDGTIRWRGTFDAGTDPFTSKRIQKTHTCDTFDEIKKHESHYKKRQKLHRRPPGDGLILGPTVDDILDEYLDALASRVTEKTIKTYAGSLRMVRRLIGGRKARAITDEDIRYVENYLLERGRLRGGQPETPLKQRSVDHAINRLRAAYEYALLRGRVTRRLIPVRVASDDVIDLSR